MENASWLEIVLRRLRFLTRPVPLASTVGALLLAVFVWDYLRHPEWFGAYESNETGPNEELDLSGLSPDEQVAVSGIDNLTLLFNELGIESGAIPRVQALGEDVDAEQNAFLNETLALAQPDAPGSSLGDSPFTRYLEQYQFGSGSSFSNTAASGNAGNPLFGGVSFFQRGSREQQTETAESINPLTRALQNQTGQIVSTQADADTPLANGLRSQSADTNESETSEAGSEAVAQGNLPPGEFSSQTVAIPGVDFPVLPTLPQMSPPPGTTGYTPPASLELMPPLPGSNTTSSPSFPAAPSFVPGAAGTSDLSSGGAVPSTGTSDIDVSNGFVTPYTPVVPSTTTAVPAPAPFTAPRAPGTYTGGGYINTFSNPNGPSN